MLLSPMLRFSRLYQMPNAVHAHSVGLTKSSASGMATLPAVPALKVERESYAQQLHQQTKLLHVDAPSLQVSLQSQRPPQLLQVQLASHLIQKGKEFLSTGQLAESEAMSQKSMTQMIHPPLAHAAPNIRVQVTWHPWVQQAMGPHLHS